MQLLVCCITLSNFCILEGFILFSLSDVYIIIASVAPTSHFVCYPDFLPNVGNTVQATYV
jgi:hypothetical protein